MSNFFRCLAIGREVERQAAGVLEGLGFRLIGFSPRGCKEYDFAMEYNGREFKFECKYDAYSCKNNDIVIEYQCSGKPSGITSSIAHFWIIRACNTMFVISAQKLRELIAGGLYYRLTRSERTRMYVFRKDLLLRHGKIIKEYEEG